MPLVLLDQEDKEEKEVRLALLDNEASLEVQDHKDNKEHEERAVAKALQARLDQLVKPVPGDHKDNQDREENLEHEEKVDHEVKMDRLALLVGLANVDSQDQAVLKVKQDVQDRQVHKEDVENEAQEERAGLKATLDYLDHQVQIK